jgi:hypothetical protein
VFVVVGVGVEGGWSGGKREEAGGFVAVDGGGVGKSDALAVCALSYTATPLRLRV